MERKINPAKLPQAEPVAADLRVVDAARAKIQAEYAATPVTALRLPIQVLTRGDVSRLGREVDELETFFTQAAVQGASAKTLPQASQQLTALLNENKLNLVKKEDRLALGVFLHGLRASAPVVHASFASDPKPDFLMKIAAWFRKEAHPNVLFQVGLQPGLAAGCIFRTTNKYFDFSFKKHFEANKAKLSASLKGSS